MNLPEILGQAGARSTPKPSDDGIKPVEDENADAFMTSVISAGGEADGQPSEDAEIDREVGGQLRQLSDQIGPQLEKMDGAPNTETVSDDAAIDALGQVLLGINDDAIESPEPPDIATPIVPVAQATPSDTPADPQSLTVNSPVTTGIAASNSAVSPVAGADELPPTSGVTAQKARSGAIAQPIPSEGMASKPKEAVPTSPVVKPPTSPNQEVPNGVLKVAVATHDQTPSQMPSLASNDAKPRELTTSSTQPASPPVDAEIEASLADDAAEQQSHDRRRDSEPTPRVVNREDAGVRTTSLRSAGASAPAQMAISGVDGSISGSAPASPAPGTQTPAARATVPGAMAAPTRDRSDGPGRSTVQQITAALRHQPLLQKIDLTLDPPELGRVEIQLEVAESGMRATLAAERATTGEIIRRQADVLLQQLDDAGFDDVSLDFRDFGGDGHRGSSFDPDPETSPPNKLGEAVADQPVPARRHTIADTGMDIRL